MKIRSFRELTAHLGNDWQNVMAQTLASISYNAISNNAVRAQMLERLRKTHFDEVHPIAKNVIWLTCHTLSGAAHTVQLADGPVGGYVGTLLGSMFTDLADQLKKNIPEPVSIEIPAKAWNADAEQNPVFGSEVQEKAAKILADRLENECREQPPKAGSRPIFAFLAGLGVDMKKFCKKERDDIVTGLEEARRNIADNRKNMRRKFWRLKI